MEAMKKCSYCKQLLPLSNYWKDSSKKDGKHHNCKTCVKAFNASYRARNTHSLSAKRRTAHLKRSYGLSEEEYDALLVLQGAVCAICGTANTETFRGKVKRMAVDHDHTTGAVRGLLCGPCNQGIGSFGDNPDRMLAAVEYLKKQLTSQQA